MTENEKTPSPTEAELAAIKVRAARATSGPWAVYPDVARLNEIMPDAYGPDDVVIHRPPQSRKEATETFFHTILSGRVSKENAEFMACARTDVEALVAAVEERDGVIHDMQQENWAYDQGVEDGRREFWQHLRPQDKEHYRDQVLLEFDRSLPPDQVRLENVRLRAAIGEIARNMRYVRGCQEADNIKRIVNDILSKK
jgi:hypothetical protein